MPSAVFNVTNRTYTYNGGVVTSVLCVGGPIFDRMTRLRIYKAALASDDTLGDHVDTTSTQGVIIASQAEFAATCAAVQPASGSNPIPLTLQYTPESNPQFVDVTSVQRVIQPALPVLQAIQGDVATISTTTQEINDRLSQELSAAVGELRQLTALVRLGLDLLGAGGAGGAGGMPGGPGPGEGETYARSGERLAAAQSYPPIENLDPAELDDLQKVG